MVQPMPNAILDTYTLPSIINFDNLFITTPNAMTLNSLLLEKSSDEIVELICDVSADKDDSVATCDCGDLAGDYYEGIKCSACGTLCTADLFNRIKNDIWLEIPNSIIGVLNPQVYKILDAWLGNVSKLPILESILDMSKPVEPIAGTPFFTSQGFNWFHTNFQLIIDHFVVSHPNKLKRSKGKYIKAFLMKSGDSVWCTKLPILSKVIQPITKHSDTARYADPDLKCLMRAIFTLGSTLISEKMMKFTADHIERNFIKVYQEFINYTTDIIKFKLPKKESVLRKHVFGTRYHFTGRSVVTAIMGPHDADEIYLPWKLGVMMYKYHIISVLANQFGMTILSANDRVMTAINIYDHEVDLILQQLIADAPTKGLPVLMNRNPSLTLASIQLVYVTRIKPSLKENPLVSTLMTNDLGHDSIIQLDEEYGFASEYSDDEDTTLRRGSDKDPSKAHGRRSSDVAQTEVADRITRYIEDSTIELSPLVIRPMNLDFDGDELNLLMLCEADEVHKFKNTHPSNRIFSASDLTIDGKSVSISNQQLVLLNGWIND